MMNPALLQQQFEQSQSHEDQQQMYDSQLSAQQNEYEM